MPFAGYEDFDDCVRKNQDKDDPRAYCGKLQAEAEGKGDMPNDATIDEPRAGRPKLVTKNVSEMKSISLDIKQVESSGEFVGYAAVFDNVDLHGDKIMPGAFKNTIEASTGMVPILDQHDHKTEIGMTTSMTEDDAGLRIEGKLYVDEDDPRNEIQAAREALVKMRARSKLGKPQPMSIGYRAINPRWTKGIRELHEIALGEVSVVTFPANQKAGVLSVKEMSPSVRGMVSRAMNHLESALGLLSEAGWLDDDEYRAATDKGSSTSPPPAGDKGADEDPDATELKETLRRIRAKHGFEPNTEGEAL